MIGKRAIAAALIAVGALVPLLGSGGPDPSASIAGRALVLERATAADAALDELERAVAPGLDLARTGAARVVNGESSPGEALVAARHRLADADPVADRAARAVRALEGARRAICQESPSIEPPVEDGELGSIAVQLAGTADAADRFAAMRLRAERVLVLLGEVADALGDGDVASARAALAVAREDHAAVAGWQVGVATLPVWVEAADALLGAAEALVLATAAGDAAAASEAADAFAAQRDGAAGADRALRIAIGEGGLALTAAPLGRLADLLRRTGAARMEVAAILHSVDR